MNTMSLAFLPKSGARSGLLALALAATVVLGACSGSAGPAVVAVSPSQAPTEDLPRLVYDFDRVCTTQVGFSGAAAYDTQPGVHPVALFSEYGDPPSLRFSSIELPAGWSVKGSASSSELATIELIACARRLEAKANGTCEFEGKDGAPPTTLEMIDTTDELIVYAATTGKQVGDRQTLKAAPVECPMFAFIKEGDTKYFNDPTEDQFVNALKAFVSPGS